MTLGRLQVSVTLGQIAFSGQSAAVDIRQPLPHFSQQVTRGGIDVETIHPRLQLDQSQCFAEEGLKSNAQLVAEFAQQGMADAREGMRQQADWGADMLEQAPFDRDVIAQMALSKTIKKPQLAQLRFMPSQPPHMSFTENQFHMQAAPDTLHINWSVYPTAQVEVARQAQLQVEMVRDPQVTVEPILPQNSLDVRA